ncbi:cysteine protease ATG4B isoform X1 [Theropithecus gelada]|uniref:cysteine protease ATG4B isoform X1 n=1 Tax=Theropithecus gelada TaxID=9565 RepID=UPI000DC1B1E1|nr:cysteine protease ATG4B isoform X1 [Theropithecus gelada]
MAARTGTEPAPAAWTTAPGSSKRRKRHPWHAVSRRTAERAVVPRHDPTPLAGRPGLALARPYAKMAAPAYFRLRAVSSLPPAARPDWPPRRPVPASRCGPVGATPLGSVGGRTGKMDAATLTYDTLRFAEYEDFPETSEPVWILGRKYSIFTEKDEILSDVASRLWFTYRKNFPAIGGTGPTSDTGWGCMLRCGQMIFAQALVCRHLGRDWRWTQRKRQPDSYFSVLNAFIDRKDSYYSIHQIAQMGVGEGKSIGQWYGPNTVAQVLKKLAVFDTWSSLAVHIAMDNTVVMEEISKWLRVSVDKKVEIMGSTCSSSPESPQEPRRVLSVAPCRAGAPWGLHAKPDAQWPRCPPLVVIPREERPGSLEAETGYLTSCFVSWLQIICEGVLYLGALVWEFW